MDEKSIRLDHEKWYKKNPSVDDLKYERLSPKNERLVGYRPFHP
jgi:hypothetical protein